MCSVPAMVAGSMGLNLFQGLSMRNAAKERARQTYQMALQANKSAEESLYRGTVSVNFLSAITTPAA